MNVVKTFLFKPGGACLLLAVFTTIKGTVIMKTMSAGASNSRTNSTNSFNSSSGGCNHYWSYSTLINQTTFECRCIKCKTVGNFDCSSRR